MPSSPCLSPPISPRTSPPTTTACGHQLSRKHSRQECSAPLPCLNRVHSTPSAYRPKAWRARASRAFRSVRDAHRHSEASSQSPYHRPAPAAETAVRHTGSPLRSAAPCPPLLPPLPPSWPCCRAGFTCPLSFYDSPILSFRSPFYASHHFLLL